MDVAKCTNFGNEDDQAAGVLSKVERQSIETT